MWEESTKEKLKEGFYAYMNEDWAEELSLAVDVSDVRRDSLPSAQRIRRAEALSVMHEGAVDSPAWN
jgi:hypothetical protein